MNRYNFFIGFLHNFKIPLFFKGIFIFLTVLAILSGFELTNAQVADHILISEIAIMGLAGAYDEFVEVYNPTLNSIDISGWRLQSKPAMGNTWINRTGENGLPANSIIPSKGYFLIAAENYSLSISPDYRHSARWGLSDQGGHIRVVDKTGNEIDKVGYGLEATDAEGNQPALVPQESSQSLERKYINGEFQDTNNNQNDFIIRSIADPQNSKFLTSESQKEIANSPLSDNSDSSTNSQNNLSSPSPPNTSSNLPSPLEYAKEIMFSEFLPNPKGNDEQGEWLEIYNFGRNAVNLKDWQIDDKVSQGSKPFAFLGDFFIGPGEFKVLFYNETKITINNSDEELNLLWPGAKVAYKVSFIGEAPEGVSFAWDGKAWQWTATPTPGAQNIISTLLENKEPIKTQTNKESNSASGSNSPPNNQVPNLSKTLGESKDFPLVGTISEIKKDPGGTWVKFKSWVVVETGLFGEGLIYVNDESGGIKVNLPSNNFSVLIKRDDEIEILGYINDVDGKKQVNLSNFGEELKVVGHKILSKELVSTGQINKFLSADRPAYRAGRQDLEAQLVSVEGEVLSKNKDYFLLDDGSGKAKIYLSDSLKSVLEKFKTGSVVNVSGIVEVDEENFYLRPRDKNDITITKLAGVSASDNIVNQPKNDIFTNNKGISEISETKNPTQDLIEREADKKEISNSKNNSPMNKAGSLFNVWFYFIFSLIFTGAILIWKFFPAKK